MLTADPRVVTPTHLALLRLVVRANERNPAPNLRLEGGTALAAYHLGHRQSRDLDLFADPGVHAWDFGETLRAVAEPEGFALEPLREGGMAGFAQYLARHASSGVDIRLDLAVAPPFHLAPRDQSEEGLPVASFRDLCAGKLHAICDRYEPRDFIDLHAILTRPEEAGESPGEAQLRDRFRMLVADLVETDPGLDASLVGQGLLRGRGQRVVADLPLRVFLPLTDAEVQHTLAICIDECVEMTSAAVRPRIP